MNRRRDGVGNLSNEEKLRLCAFSQENPTMSQKDLCAWAQRTFALSKAPCQATISNILRKRALLQSMNAQDLVCKRRRVLKNPELDRALGNWVLYCLHKGLKVSGELIKKQAATFAELLHPRGDVDMAFSNGWLAGFQDRYGIKKLKRAAPQQSAASLHQHQLTGATSFSDSLPPMLLPEPVPAPLVPFADYFSLADLQLLVSAYASRDVYHMDEFGLYYNMPLDQPQPAPVAVDLDTASPVAPTPARATLTVVVAVNGDGSDRVEPFFVGKALRPKSFQDKLAPELGFQYYHNQKGLMNGLLFQRWVQAFNSRMRDENRHVVLLVDSAVSHVVVGLELTHVKVAFLAVKGTAKLQPLNSGVVKALKRRYRLAHFVNALDRSEQSQRDIFAVTQLEAMRWVKQCWSEISKDLIQHCWAKTRIFGGDALTPLEKRRMKLEDEVEDDIYKHIQWLSLANPLTMEEMLNPDGENDVHAGVAIQDFADCAIENEFETEAPVETPPTVKTTVLNVVDQAQMLEPQPHLQLQMQLPHHLQPPPSHHQQQQQQPFPPHLVAQFASQFAQQQQLPPAPPLLHQLSQQQHHHHHFAQQLHHQQQQQQYQEQSFAQQLQQHTMADQLQQTPPSQPEQPPLPVIKQQPHVDALADLAALTNEQKLSHLSFAIRILNEHGALESSKQELRAVQRSIRDAIVEQRRLSRR